MVISVAVTCISVRDKPDGRFCNHNVAIYRTESCTFSVATLDSDYDSSMELLACDLKRGLEGSDWHLVCRYKTKRSRSNFSFDPQGSQRFWEKSANSISNRRRLSAGVNHCSIKCTRTGFASSLKRYELCCGHDWKCRALKIQLTT